MSAIERPRDVGLHGPCKWFVDHADGTVTLIVRRTADSGVRHGLEHRFHGENDAAALAAFDAWGAAQYEEATRRARRMAKWGPTGTGKMS
jgi:hypothetical protein